jgi:hypothetical protein
LSYERGKIKITLSRHCKSLGSSTLHLTSVAEKLDEEEEKIEAKNMIGAAADADNDQEDNDDLSGEEEEEGDEGDEGGFLPVPDPDPRF